VQLRLFPSPSPPPEKKKKVVGVCVNCYTKADGRNGLRLTNVAFVSLLTVPKFSIPRAARAHTVTCISKSHNVRKGVLPKIVSVGGFPNLYSNTIAFYRPGASYVRYHTLKGETGAGW